MDTVLDDSVVVDDSLAVVEEEDEVTKPEEVEAVKIELELEEEPPGGFGLQ